MASTRLYVRDLPYNITESEFKKHFVGTQSGAAAITDTRIIPHRRIGFVGYRTSEDAQKAVKYFNKTFIRTSRLTVELARPVPEPKVVEDFALSNDAGVNGEKVAEKSTGKKRKVEDVENDDPKLKEFLEISRSKRRKRLEGENDLQVAEHDEPVADLAGQQSDEEYEEIPKNIRRDEEIQAEQDRTGLGKTAEDALADVADPGRSTVSDADWARSRTSKPTVADGGGVNSTSPEHKKADHEEINESATHIPTEKTAIEKVHESMRLFLRNLSFDTTEEDLEAAFEPHGNLEEIHINLDKASRKSKCTAFVQFSDAESAKTAMREMDGKALHGRLLHILPAAPKRDYLDSFALSKLPLKKQREIQRKREATSKTFNWNSLYMNPDAVVSSVAGRLGLAKSEILDPTSSDAAVKQAQAETNIIQETKAYFEQHGVDLTSFKRKQRGDSAILVKNLPYDSKDELKRKLEEHGELKKFLVPPAGTIAIVEFDTEGQGQAAFAALNRHRFKSSMLYLEKAPKGLFEQDIQKATPNDDTASVVKDSVSRLKDTSQTNTHSAGRATLFVGNLNFDTTNRTLTETFGPLAGFMSAVVRTRTDPKRPGEVLSNGYGFLEFKTPQQALAAAQAMNGYKLDDHKLELKLSNKGPDSAEERRKFEHEKKAAGIRTKISIKNLDFGVTKKDIRSLFGAYGQLRSVRVPKKMDRSARGFGFADFTTPKEAQSAMDALKDTHLLSRKLVLEFADEEPADAEVEIEKMQKKVGAQANNVALRNLTSGGRRKFTTQAEDDAA